MYKFIVPETPISDITEELYNKYVIHLQDTLCNDVSVNTYLRDLITTLHFLMGEKYMEPFVMKSIKGDPYV